MLVIAHRGASGSERENTWEAFRAAYEMGARAVETDVRRCPFCKTLKLSHDPISSEQECDTLMNFKDFLNFGEWMILNVELKERGIAKEVARLVKRLRHKDAITYSSFLWRELRTLKKQYHYFYAQPKISLLWDQGEFNVPWWLVVWVSKIVGAKSICLDFTMIIKNPEIVIYFRKKGFEVYAYTLNSEKEIKLAKKLELDGIFTDFPAYAAYILSGKDLNFFDQKQVT